MEREEITKEIEKLKIEVPDTISLENAILDKNHFQDMNGKKSGFLNEHSRIFFFPTEEEFYDQCFNLNDFLSALILPRIIYFRDNRQTLGINDDDLNIIIKGLWIDVNVDCIAWTEEQEELVKSSRELLIKNWQSLWF